MLQKARSRFGSDVGTARLRVEMILCNECLKQTKLICAGLTMAKVDDDNDDASEIEPSSLETNFVEREDDGETLWEVVEIVDEKKNWYKVRWAGFDPATNKQWPLDWVPKADCTDPLVRAWKLKKAEKKKQRVKSRQKCEFSST